LAKTGLNKSDEEVVDLLIDMGLSRKTARTLTYLSQVGETQSRNIERFTELRQPEVSTAIKELRTRGWVKKRDIKKEGKGRPIHAYSLTVPLNVAIKSIVSSKKSEIERIETNIKRLRELTK
jgi:predicted transcriptional regulator